ncbi:MAG: hypothetical protein HY814_00145 [Candidatus Riflebacteria bacterium]|nr:hypothetical protein [Candidatus Riflebacteria bacterium]
MSLPFESNTLKELSTRLSNLREQLVELARRLASGDKKAYNAFKFQKRTAKKLELELRTLEKRERRLAFSF